MYERYCVRKKSEKELTDRQVTGRNGLQHLLAHCKQRYCPRREAQVQSDKEHTTSHRRVSLHQGLRRERKRVRLALQRAFEELGPEEAIALLDHSNGIGWTARIEGDAWFPYCITNVRTAAHWLGTAAAHGGDGGIESRLWNLEEHWLRKPAKRDVYPLLSVLLSRGNVFLDLVRHLCESADAQGLGERLRMAVMATICATKTNRLQCLGTEEIWEALKLEERHCQFVEPRRKRSVLHCCLQPESTRWFLEHGAASLVNEFDRNRNAPLQCHMLSSLEAEGPSSVPVLLEFGADPSKGYPAPLFLCTLQHVRNGVFEALLRAGADSTQRLGYGKTSLFSLGSWVTPAAVKLVLRSGFDLQSTTRTGDTALMELVAVSLGLAHRDIVRMLVAHGCDVNASNNSGFTALHLTNFSCEVLVESGARTDVLTSFGGSPLFHFVARANHAIPEELLHPAIIDTMCTEPRSHLPGYALRPLTVACWRCCLQHVQQLLDAGACPNSIPCETTSPLREACIMMWTDGVELLLRQGAELTPEATLMVPGCEEELLLQEVACKFVGRRTKRA